MKPILYVGLDVHKDSITVATAPQGDTEVHLYGQISGTLDALDKLIGKLQKPDLELRFVYEASPCGYVIHRHLTHASSSAKSSLPLSSPPKPVTGSRPIGVMPANWPACSAPAN